MLVAVVHGSCDGEPARAASRTAQQYSTTADARRLTKRADELRLIPGKSEEALRTINDAIDCYSRLLADEPRLKDEIAKCFSIRGWIQFDQGKLAEAAQDFRWSREQFERVEDIEQRELNVAHSSYALGTCLIRQTRYAEAEGEFSRSIGLYYKYGVDRDANRIALLADALGARGVDRYLQGNRNREAKEDLEKALEFASRIPPGRETPGFHENVEFATETLRKVNQAIDRPSGHLPGDEESSDGKQGERARDRDWLTIAVTVVGIVVTVVGIVVGIIESRTIRERLRNWLVPPIKRLVSLIKWRRKKKRRGKRG